MILILEFKTFKSTLIVLSVIPLGVIGGVTMLWLTGNPMSFVAIIGFIGLAGIEVKNSILLVDFTNQLREEGKSLDDMMAYVDEYGNISSTPPDPAKVRTVSTDDIVIGVPRQRENQLKPVRQGRIIFFNVSKGYGFIKDDETGESIFVHNNDLASPVHENDAVTFETQRGVKGLAAIRVKKV